MRLNDLMLLQHPVNVPSAFTAEALVTAVREERSLSSVRVPRVCLLEFDGDLTDWLVASGHAHPSQEALTRRVRHEKALPCRISSAG